MLEKIKKRILPHLIGLTFIFLGWYMSIISVGLDRLTAQTLITKPTMVGLALIIIGAYLPELWVSFKKDQ